jgi:adenylosuccinate synthase
MGDEGKGRSLMFLPQIMILLLVFKGPNAGHTLEFDGKSMYLEPFLLEFFHKTAKRNWKRSSYRSCSFPKEIEGLEKFKLDIKSKLIISRKAH